jgi:hypothetical protein
MDAKKKAQETVHAYQQTLIDLSHRIHDHPELGFAEEQASRWITRSSPMPVCRWRQVFAVSPPPFAREQATVLSILPSAPSTMPCPK